MSDFTVNDLTKAAQMDATLADKNGWAIEVIDVNALEFRKGDDKINAFYSGASNGVYSGFIKTGKFTTSLGIRRSNITPRQLVRDALKA
ncbi:hypothetical protein SEA_FORZA_46 [Gordonia phage Forza]|uniref:Uncharacterized protein n=1 Tax=Gordonia phage Forza TaxID=2571247 RepID=A0A650EYY5_9CAUD|nr:hypothetical protein PP303_gp046 [Gordonia phage Forza]QEM41516.1 hypothetical protein SEA_BOOPY_47 [Gordonia phage Boopy]QGT55039.1 hypothetical protein SEA_FORZA_46 [Gordonia phage Forza]UXE04189.1 hypothetical protein SEA_BLUENGOLD_45 [Gordonia phage BlueNGold]WBF03828.1 hypothetical protein SEA_MAREELIH_45 [Gordonia phage Mareelih]